jgi:EAL domain-containing protein (putative c-di-GMP-specific phosphodiesterase class I)
VETEDQLATLRELGCDAGQGFLFSPPLAAKDLEAFLSKV